MPSMHMGGSHTLLFHFMRALLPTFKILHHHAMDSPFLQQFVVMDVLRGESAPPDKYNPHTQQQQTYCNY